MNINFPIDSNQLLLLYHLEYSTSLEQLSLFLHKEKSVVSKNLKSLSYIRPLLIEKENRKWKVTKIGKEVNKITGRFVKELVELIPQEKSDVNILHCSPNAVLMIVNPQKAFKDEKFGNNSNPEAVKNIKKIVEKWRSAGRKVVYVKHESNNEGSPLFREAKGGEFIEEIKPTSEDRILTKTTPSAFSDINLEKDFDIEVIDAVVLVGFTAAECIDATARDSHRLGIPTYVVADAVAAHGLVGPNGELFHSKLVLGVALASLHNKVAKILDTQTLLSELHE